VSELPFRERLRTIAENLLTLEVNTILSPHIEAEKMPPPEHALIDVANMYRSWLRDKHGQSDMWASADVSEASTEVFTRVRVAAERLIESATKLNQSDMNMLERIKGNSDQFLSIFGRLDSEGGGAVKLRRWLGDHRPSQVELQPEEIVVVRKAWELGLDEVVMQTTIMLDGDVVTRIRRGLMDDPEGLTAMKLHEKAVVTSTTFWSKLVDILGGAIRGLVELFSSAG